MMPFCVKIEGKHEIKPASKYLNEYKKGITIFASDWTGCGEEGPGIPGTLGTTVTGLTSYDRTHVDNRGKGDKWI